MSLTLRATTLAPVLLSSLFLAGCISTSRRNTRDSALVLVRAPYEKQNVEFILELERTRERVALAELEEFLASARLGPALERSLMRRRRLIEATLPSLRAEASRKVVLARPEPDRRLSAGNFVAYVQGESGFHAYCSLAELGRVFGQASMSPDLKTLRFTDARIQPAVLGKLLEELEAAGIEVREAHPSEADLQSLRVRTAAGILEKKLRDSGRVLDRRLPLLESGTFADTHSPKLSKALAESSALEEIIRSGDADAIRALVYLLGRGAVGLER